MFALTSASSSEGDRPTVVKSKFWKFIIPDPSCRPFVEGGMKHVSYDTHSDRITGCVSYNGPQSNPLRKYDATVTAISAAEFHDLFPAMAHHSGTSPMNRTQAMANADATNRRHVTAAAEGRLCDLPEKSRAFYMRYNRAHQDELRATRRAAKMKSADKGELPYMDPQSNETQYIDVSGGTYNAVTHNHGPVHYNSGPVTYVNTESTMTAEKDGNVTEDNLTNTP